MGMLQVTGRTTRGTATRGQRLAVSTWLRLQPPVALMGAIALGAATPAQAVDGCQVLLCLAAPSWRSISQCVPPVTQVFRDLARGRPFPICAMAGPGNASSHAWTEAPRLCPPQYSRVYDGPNGPVHACDFNSAISVMVQGHLFSTTWWSMGGDSVTEFSPAAKARLGSWDTRFDDEHAAWLARQATQAATQN